MSITLAEVRRLFSFGPPQSVSAADRVEASSRRAAFLKAFGYRAGDLSSRFIDKL